MLSLSCCCSSPFLTADHFPGARPSAPPSRPSHGPARYLPARPDFDLPLWPDPALPARPASCPASLGNIKLDLLELYPAARARPTSRKRDVESSGPSPLHPDSGRELGLQQGKHGAGLFCGFGGHLNPPSIAAKAQPTASCHEAGRLSSSRSNPRYNPVPGRTRRAAPPRGPRPRPRAP